LPITDENMVGVAELSACAFNRSVHIMV